MKTKSKFKKLLLPLGMLSVIVATSVATTSCAVVDSTNKFRIVNQTSLSENIPFKDLSGVNHSVKNIIYGTTAINDGNYVMAVATNSDLNQYEFLHGSKRPGTNDLWKGQWGTAIQGLDGKFDDKIYPNGIQFLLFNDDYIDENSWNPFAIYPDKKDDSSATQEEKDNSNKFRREDQSAKDYRDIVNFLISTYESESVPNSWKITGNEDSDKPGKDITKIMVIAFKNVDGKIERNFYNGTSGDSGGSEEGDTDGNTEGGSTRIAINTNFSDFLTSFYGNKQ